METGKADFRLIRPVAVTSAMIVSCTVPESVVTEYSGASTYAAGDIRGVTTGATQLVYESLQASNLNNTPASSPLWWKLLGTVYATYAAGTSYAVGAIVTDLVNHKLYESLVAANLGNALTDETKWLDLGPTNRWNQFDKAVNTQTTAPDSISLTLAPGTLVSTLVGLNVSGATATLSQSESGYSQTQSLVKHDVLSWYDFFYQEPVRVGDFAFTDVPPYATSDLTLTVTNPGSEAAIGGCFIGKSITLGETEWGFTGGVQSFSTATTDVAGNVRLVKRNKAKRLNFKVYIKPGYESEAYRILDEYTDVEIVIIGARDYSLSFAYGFLGQWEIPVSISIEPATIEFKGLT